MTATRDDILQVLTTVLDPEVPVLDVVSMGIVRDAVIGDDGSVQVVITPTYSGCPAMHTIETNISTALRDAGFPQATIKTVLSPAWTTDWMTDDAREKLREYGIAPPDKNAAVACGAHSRTVSCPRGRDRKHGLQGAVRLPGLPRAVRTLQVHLSR